MQCSDVSVLLSIRTNLAKVAVCYSGLAKIFRAPIYWVYRAVVFAIAQLSCYSVIA